MKSAKSVGRTIGIMLLAQMVTAASVTPPEVHERRGARDAG
jgi:hypothetical protein